MAAPELEGAVTPVRTLIVDGYNVIHCTEAYALLADHDLDAARAALVSDVAAYAHGDWSATVVFDGHSNPASEGLAHHISGVTVVFSRFGVDADSVIENLARGDESVVVTSDAQTQWAVVGGSVSRMSSAEFSGELRDGGREWTEHAPSGSRSGRLEDRIAEEAREQLWRWARGIE
jgi:uncharacterized protein